MKYFKVVERLVKCFHYKMKLKFCDLMEVLANSTVEIILKYINVSNHVYTLNLHNVLCQIYLNKKIAILPKW